jgi:hypothetical protein
VVDGTRHLPGFNRLFNAQHRLVWLLHAQGARPRPNTPIIPPPLVRFRQSRIIAALALYPLPLLLTTHWFGHPGTHREADGRDAVGMHRQGTDGGGGGRGLEGWNRCMVYR